MTFFIRPRQDFSLATMARAMRCLECCDFSPRMYVYAEGYAEGKSSIIIFSVGVAGDSDDEDFCERAIATLIDMEHFTRNNFKIIELSPGEVMLRWIE